MLHKLRESHAKRDEGFTLIELLVVVIIIGILAAIAIPVFLNQRRKAWDAAVKSDLRNAATAQETYLTENDAYSVNTAGLASVGFNQSGSVTFVTVTATAGTAYCMEANHQSDPANTYWYLNNTTGEPQSGSGAC